MQISKSKLTKTLFSLGLILFTIFVPPTLAIEPFFPFSKEGNPPEDYYFNELFPLFVFIRPPALQVYENQDESRNYEDIQICRYEGADRRDYDCNSNDPICEGGEVDVCYKGGDKDGQFANTVKSGKKKCKLPPPDPNNPTAFRKGHCEYTKVPVNKHTIMGTDFSANDTANNSPEYNTFKYSKYQDEAGRYSNHGDKNNLISFGSHHLAFNQCDKATKQLLVVTRARQTKDTVTNTGTWPLGWVDWGYTTKNGKTLLEIYKSLPPEVKGAGNIIVEGVDDYYLNGANFDIISDISKPKQLFCDTFNQAINNNQTWAADLNQTPLYSPSFRQGYSRTSICTANECCPGLRCKHDVSGNSKGLYYDVSVSQAFGGALDDFLFSYSQKQAQKKYKEIIVNNPLVRFLTSASPQAIPSVVTKRLTQELKNDKCFQRLPHPFNWSSFGLIFDYLNNYRYILDPKNPQNNDTQCPGYKLQKGVVKETGGSFAKPSLISKIISFFWNKKEDEAIASKNHLITIPDAMGQALSQIQNYVHLTQDSYSELTKNQQTQTNPSNIINDQADFLFAGKTRAVADAKRKLQLFSCSSSEYSDPTTNILAYALGTRIGCNDTQNSPDNQTKGWNCQPSTNISQEKHVDVESASLYVEQLYAWCDDKQKNAFKLCYQDAMQKADGANINPLLTLAFWIHESGASNYSCGQQLTHSIIEDFGIYNDPNTPDENFTLQLQKFLQLPKAYEAKCGVANMENFIAQFWFGQCYSNLNQNHQKKVQGYLTELQTIWNRINLNKTQPLPSYFY